jgi:hypothetical protein
LYPAFVGYKAGEGVSSLPAMHRPVAPLSLAAGLALLAATLTHCSSSSNSNSGEIDCSSVSPDAATTTSDDTCYPDNDGINDETYTIAIAVDDTGFTATGGDVGDSGPAAKNIIATQNDSQVTLTLTNNGTIPHGFRVGCVSVCSSYPTLPAGCSPEACFPAGATIAPIAPGASVTVTFDTPTPDGLIYPFSSSAPGDSAVPGLNQGQWSLM